MNYTINCNCKCIAFCNSSQSWVLSEIDPYSGVTLRTIDYNSIASVSLNSLTLFKAKLKYGVYKLGFSLALNVLQKDVFGLFLSAPKVVLTSYTESYFKIVPTGFVLAAFNSDLFQNSSSNQLVVGILDSISFVPVFFSYDLDNLTDSNSLEYNFYCCLVSKNQVLNNFNQSLYSIVPDVELTSEQIESENTCFKSKGQIF